MFTLTALAKACDIRFCNGVGAGIVLDNGLSLGNKPSRVDDVIPEYDFTDLEIAAEVLFADSETLRWTIHDGLQYIRLRFTASGSVARPRW